MNTKLTPEIYTATVFAGIQFLVSFSMMWMTGWRPVFPFYVFSIYFLLFWLLGFAFAKFLLSMVTLIRLAQKAACSVWTYLLFGLVTPLPVVYVFIEFFAHGHGATHTHFTPAEQLSLMKHSGVGAAAAIVAWYFDKAVIAAEG